MEICAALRQRWHTVCPEQNRGLAGLRRGLRDHHSALHSKQGPTPEAEDGISKLCASPPTTAVCLFFPTRKGAITRASPYSAVLRYPPNHTKKTAQPEEADSGALPFVCPASYLRELSLCFGLFAAAAGCDPLAQNAPRALMPPSSDNVLFTTHAKKRREATGPRSAEASHHPRGARMIG